MSDNEAKSELTRDHLGSTIKEKLFGLGYFWDDANKTNLVSERQLAELPLTDTKVADAIAKYQAFQSQELDRISLLENGRPAKADGAIGPATIQLLESPRCGFPDFGPGVHAATGSGSWPAGCHRAWPENHAFGIHLDKQGMPGYLEPVIDECIRRVFEAYQNIGIFFFLTKSKSDANTLVTWTRGRGWIGLAIVPRSPGCSDRIWAKFDNRYRPGKLIDQWSRLLAHEWGHNMGLSHSNGGIMNPSISSGFFSDDQWRSDPSFSQLKRWFGGERILDDDDGGDDDDDDKPDPPSDKIVIRGELKITVGDGEPQAFILTPKVVV
jgi:hypothetical protein